MGRIIGLRKKARIPEFEEALVRLQDELALTESFAGKMVRDGNYKAALAVVDEQRGRLAEAQEAMIAAFRPRFRRAQVAIGGLAAVMLLGGASFAALNFVAPDAHSAEALQRAEKSMARAASASTTEQQAQALVRDAFDELSSLGDDVASDPSFRQELRTMLMSKLGVLLKQRPRMAPLLRAHLRDLEQRVPVDVPEPKPERSEQAQPVDAPSQQQPPAPPDPAGGH